MKAIVISILAFLSITLSTYTVAGCSSSRGCGQGYCESEYENQCQCTDPSCNTRHGSDCLSKRECCEAFGNVGAR